MLQVMLQAALGLLVLCQRRHVLALTVQDVPGAAVQGRWWLVAATRRLLLGLRGTRSQINNQGRAGTMLHQRQGRRVPRDTRSVQFNSYNYEVLVWHSVQVKTGSAGQTINYMGRAGVHYTTDYTTPKAK